MNYIIVTNTYNRSLWLVERSIRASLNQKIPPRNVILIDQNSNELVLPEDITNNPLFVKTQTNKKSVSAARNTLKIPEGTEWIFFCDDDGYPCDNYSEILQRLILENPQLDVLAGSYIRDDNNEYYTIRHKIGGSLKYFRYTKNLLGSNYVIKAKVYDEIGRYDENFGPGAILGSGDETDICWKAYFSGKKIEFFPELIVYHLPPFNESIKSGFKKAFKYGVGKGALVSKWLFKKKKIKVLYELMEMLIIPFIQSLRGLITLKFGLIATNFAALAGRIYGMIKYFSITR